jgi:hypothetical protein
MLPEAGPVSTGIERFLAGGGQRPWDIFTYPVSISGLFFGSISYLLYSYLQARKDSTI